MISTNFTTAAQLRPLSWRLFTNSLWNLSAYVAYTIVTIVCAPLYIHFLGLQRYGLLVLLSSILLPLNLLNLGFGQATVKYMAESHGRGNTGEASEYLQTTLLFNLGVGVLGALSLNLLASFLVTTVFKIDVVDQQLAQSSLRWVALGWLVTQITATLTGVPTALQQYRVVSIGTTASASVNVVIGLLVLLAGGDLLALVQARFVWSAVTILLWGVVVRQLLPGVNLWPKLHHGAFHRSLNFGIWQTVAGIGGLLGGQVDKFLLGIYTSTTQVGLFNIPSLIFQVGYGIIGKLGEVLFPAISDLQSRGLEERLTYVMLRSSWLLSVLMGALMGTLFVFAHDVLRLYVGVDIADSSSRILKILAVTATLSAPSIGVSQYLLGTGKTIWTALITITSGAITLFGGLFLIPRFGLQGAAWSNLLAIALSRPLSHLMMWRSSLRDTVRWQVFFTFLYGPALTGVLAAGVLELVRNQMGWHPTWFGLAIGLVGCFVLLGTMVVAVDFFLLESSARRSDLKFATTQFLGIWGRILPGKTAS